MSHIQIFISLCSLFGISGILHKYIKKDFSLSFYYACLAVIIILYFSVLNNSLEIIVTSLRLVGLLGIVFSMKILIQKRGQISSSLIFLITSIFFYYLISLTENYKSYSGVDDYSHWGRMMLLLSENNQLVKNTDPIAIKDNPPFAALFQYFFTYFSGFKSNLAMYGQGVWTLAVFSTMLIPIKEINTRFNKILFALTIGVIVSFIWIFGKAFHSLQTDMLLGSTFGAALIIYHCYKEKETNISILLAAPAIISLVLIKQIGIVFALFAIFYILIDILISKKNETIKKLLILFLVLACTLALRNTWIDYLSSENIEISKYPKVGIFEVFSVFFLGNANEFQQTVIKNYIDYLFFSHHTSTYWFLVSLIMVYVNNSITNKSELQNKRILNYILFGCFSVYLFILLVLYMYTFSPWEGIRIASATRYIKSMSIAMVMLFYVEFLIIIQKPGFFKLHKSKIILIYILLIIPNLGRAVNDIAISFSGKITDTGAEKIEQMANFVKKRTPVNAKIYFVWSNNTDDNTVIFNYGIYPRKTNGGCASIKHIRMPRSEDDPWSCFLTLEKFKTAVKDYDYLYIAYSSIEFKESFFVHINDKENPLGLFKIINKENKITLVRMD